MKNNLLFVLLLLCSYSFSSAWKTHKISEKWPKNRSNMLLWKVGYANSPLLCSPVSSSSSSPPSATNGVNQQGRWKEKKTKAHTGMPTIFFFFYLFVHFEKYHTTKWGGCCSSFHLLTIVRRCWRQTSTTTTNHWSWQYLVCPLWEGTPTICLLFSL